MTKDDILKMAKEANGDGFVPSTECAFIRIVAFANLVAAAEREDCARDWELAHGFDKHGVAAAIRARGQS